MAIHFFAINGAGSGGGSSMVNTANGISGDGLAGTPVILGGTLNQGTVIGLNMNSFEIVGDDGTGVTHDFFMQDGAIGLIDTNNSTNGVTRLIISGQTDFEGFQLDFTESGMGSKGIHGNENEVGLSVLDSIDNVGLTGGVNVFPLNGDAGQYLQVGNLKLVLNAAAQDTAGQTTTQIIPPAYTPLVDSIIRINAYAFYVTGTGSVAVTVDYTDRLGNPQTATLGSINSVTGVTAFPATILKVKGGTTVSVTYTVTGTITYDAGATIENLFA